MMYSCSTATEVEAIVRAEGATPATVGVIEGKVHVGLSSEELDRSPRTKQDLPEGVPERFALCYQQSETVVHTSSTFPVYPLC